MGMYYKIDVLAALKERGYSTFRMRKENILGQSYITQLNRGEIVSHAALCKIMELLRCQPGDLLGYKFENDTVKENESEQTLPKEQQASKKAKLVFGPHGAELHYF